MDRDCELWLHSEGQLKKEEQAYGPWIRAQPFVKGCSSVIKVPGFYEARKKERQQGNNKGPSPNPEVVLESQNSPVVVQLATEEGEFFREGSIFRVLVPDFEERIMGESLEKTCKSREEFEERITEIDIELNKFGNSRILGSEFDKDSIMEYNSSTNHVT